MKAEITALVVFKKNLQTVQNDPTLYGDGMTYYLELSVNRNINRIQVNNIDFESIKSQIEQGPGILESTAELSNGDTMVIYRDKKARKK
jgi:hypothetical protein